MDTAHDIASLLCLTAPVTAGYLATCMVWPFAACRRCEGSGKRRSPFSRRTFGLCNRCGGTGRRLRIGRQLINYLRAERDKGSK